MMITNYRRARRDAGFLTGWVKGCHAVRNHERYAEAISVMNGHDAIELLALLLMTDRKLPVLPDYEPGDGTPDTAA